MTRGRGGSGAEASVNQRNRKAGICYNPFDKIDFYMQLFFEIRNSQPDCAVIEKKIAKL